MSDRRNIAVTINNYEPEYSYIIRIFKQGSVIPIMETTVAPRGGRTHYFKDLPADSIYTVKVVVLCTNNQVNEDSKIAYSPLQTVCECPPGYLPNEDNTKCVRTLTQAPTVNGQALVAASGPNEGAYCREGIVVYAPGFTSDGKGGVAYQSGPGHVYWASNNETTKGRLNIAGVWNSASMIDPLDTWIGFSKKVQVPESKVYYVGIAGDNYVRIKVNGVIWVNQKFDTNAISNFHFNYWHCYPIYLNAGENIIELEGYNTDGIGCFAAEIYNCDITALQAVTPQTESTLNRLFSTLDVIGDAFNNNYSCTEGYALDTSNPAQPVCKKIEFFGCAQ